ncbi:MAG: outer membrane protein assembly factor BamD [bacterium]|nr:outer membrane protein assembly factor BamD [bacterium]
MSFAGTTRSWIALLLSALITAAIGCGGKQKQPASISQLSAEDRLGKGLALLSQHKLQGALKELGRIDQYAAANRAELEPLVRLGIADATFYQDTNIALIDARSLYLDFVTLYASHAMASYAQFQAGMCSMAQVNHPSRDQSQTHQAISDFAEVTRRFPRGPYASAARLMLMEAEANLAEHEFIVGRFYLKKKKYDAAATRFRTALDEFPGYVQKDKLYFHLGEALIQDDKPIEARLYLDKLLADYPEGPYAADARKSLASVGGVLE